MDGVATLRQLGFSHIWPRTAPTSGTADDLGWRPPLPLTAGSGVTQVAGRPGLANDLNQTDNGFLHYSTAVSDFSLAGNGAQTVAMRMLVKAWRGSGFSFIVTGTEDSGNGWRVYQEASTGRVVIAGASATTASYTQWETGRWFTVSFVWPSTTAVGLLYLDGRPITAAASGGSTASTAATCWFRVGYDATNASRSLSAVVSRLAYAPRALSPAENMTLHRAMVA